MHQKKDQKPKKAQKPGRGARRKARYAQAFEITKRNKARREEARKRRAESEATARRKAQRELRHQAKRTARAEAMKSKAELLLLKAVEIQRLKDLETAAQFSQPDTAS